MTQKQNENEALKCTYKDCENLQGDDGEFCEDHCYKKYEVRWEVSKSATVEAQSEEDAIDKVFELPEKDIEENEITAQIEAFLIKDY